MLSTSTVRKTPDQLKKMRQAGRVVAEMHASIRDAIRPVYQELGIVPRPDE